MWGNGSSVTHTPAVSGSVVIGTNQHCAGLPATPEHMSCHWRETPECKTSSEEDLRKTSSEEDLL
ncbi:hypothetical protein EYF80_057727 [Liparis tanakae]|uniref:Uncharacterized protein n=1 Tax=Liparis tanakae TaxID=230148 RepID=A0A4Z2ET85_9TELE|nr:hypothetical protein EYF80_057727 [Liparis tanakae]